MGYKCNVMAFFPAPLNPPATDQVFLSPDTYYDTPLAGKAVMSYPPDEDIVESLRYYLEQKDLDRSNTSGCFILPTHAGRRAPWSRLLNGMELLKVYSGKDRPFMKLPGGERPQAKHWKCGMTPQTALGLSTCETQSARLRAHYSGCPEPPRLTHGQSRPRTQR